MHLELRPHLVDQRLVLASPRLAPRVGLPLVFGKALLVLLLEELGLFRLVGLVGDGLLQPLLALLPQRVQHFPGPPVVVVLAALRVLFGRAVRLLLNAPDPLLQLPLGLGVPAGDLCAERRAIPLDLVHASLHGSAICRLFIIHAFLLIRHVIPLGLLLLLLFPPSLLDGGLHLGLRLLALPRELLGLEPVLLLFPLLLVVEPVGHLLFLPLGPRLLLPPPLLDAIEHLVGDLAHLRPLRLDGVCFRLAQPLVLLHHGQHVGPLLPPLASLGLPEGVDLLHLGIQLPLALRD
mmetsp:Transcript_45823/g.138919  ORF Transcript_45823/g.138919 Transcript_45823/m.138919 type:complete len:292 (+) Transcript_45823:283-1158(+)